MNSFKKIAIGLAAALSFGVLSALPTQAAVINPVLTIDSATDTVNAGESATAVITLSFISETSADTATVLSAMFSQPAGASKSGTLTLLETTTASVVIAGSNISADVNSTINTPGYVTAKFKVTLDAPSIAGTYVINIIPTKPVGAALSWTVTVKALDVAVASSTSLLNKGEVITAAADDVVFAPKTASTDAAAVIVIAPKNAAGGSATESILATVSGSGLIGYGSNATTMSALGRSLVIPTGNYIGVFADGTAGVGTITLSTLTGTVLATEKVTFYGDIATIVVTSVKSVLVVGANTTTLKAVALDASGVTVGAGTLYAYSSDVAVVSDSATAATIVDGVATFTITGVKTGGVALTVKSGTVASTPVSARVEGVAAKVKVSFDKATYAPGEAATITVQVVDAEGLSVSSKTHSNLFATGGIVSTYAFGTGSADLTGVSITTDTDTVKTFKVFMPLTQKTVTVSATGGTSLPLAGQVAVSATAEVSDAVSKAATEASEAAAKAAKEATVAAKEATDAAKEATIAGLAALKAAEESVLSAKAANAAAQDASDAVAALSVQVASLVAGLKAQLKALTKLIIKIQKRLKA